MYLHIQRTIADKVFYSKLDQHQMTKKTRWVLDTAYAWEMSKYSNIFIYLAIWYMTLFWLEILTTKGMK